MNAAQINVDPKTCEWHNCERTFVPRSTSAKYCPDHGFSSPPKLVQEDARGLVLRAIAKRYQKVTAEKDPTFKVKNIQREARDLTHQAIARVLGNFEREGLVVLEGVGNEGRRYRFVGDLGLLETSNHAGE